MKSFAQLSGVGRTPKSANESAVERRLPATLLPSRAGGSTTFKVRRSSAAFEVLGAEYQVLSAAHSERAQSVPLPNLNL